MSDPSPPTAVRLYESLRTAHLERFSTMVPAVVLYRRRRYDFDGQVAAQAQHIERAGRLRSAAELLRARYRTAEFNEPLMVPRWPDLLLQVAAARSRVILGRSRLRLGAYCIGLTDPVEALHRRYHLPAGLARPLSRLVLATIVRSMDRLAFGTQASRDLLARYVDPAVLAARSEVFPALPAPCQCPPGRRDPDAVLFLGALTERKGIRALMQAWSERPRGSESLSLQIIGTGPLEQEVLRWAERRPEVTIDIDPPRDSVHAALRRAHVLVLASQRAGAWREQLGLPILEALAHGCEVVTTNETGLADWLGEHGHRVVPSDCHSAALGAAVRDAASARRDVLSVQADLPRRDGRTEADSWLMATTDSPVRPRRASSNRRPHSTVRLYVETTRRAVRRYQPDARHILARSDDRVIFIVGSPRSGTSFTAAAIGSVPGYADLGELAPLKALIPSLIEMPVDVAARRIRRVVHVAQRLALLTGRRGVEQTPESSFLIPAIAQAFPRARFVHITRDGRDVAASLISLGWLRDTPAETEDEVGAAFGAHARFWVEAARGREFSVASEARRAAWVWRRYESSARAALISLPSRQVNIRYEELVSDPSGTAVHLARFLDATERTDCFVQAFSATRSSAHGRWRSELDDCQLAEVQAEAGPLLLELGYSD